jgi:hypothetical protein
VGISLRGYGICDPETNAPTVQAIYHCPSTLMQTSPYPNEEQRRTMEGDYPGRTPAWNGPTVLTTPPPAPTIVVNGLLIEYCLPYPLYLVDPDPWPRSLAPHPYRERRPRLRDSQTRSLVHHGHDHFIGTRQSESRCLLHSRQDFLFLPN